jgi:DUF4097 and DUF4098 domain-containing protein YvlB
VVLIVLGIVFLLGNMGYVSWGHLSRLFAHYWPVLIIVWGVIKLVEYQNAQRQGTRASGIGAGGVFLLIMLIGLGIAATQASRFDWGNLRDQIEIDDSDFTLFGEKYTYEDQLSQAFPPGDSLQVINTRGAVNISATDANEIQVSAHKHIRAEKREEADNWNSATKPQISLSGNVVTLNANNQGAGDHWVAVDMDILLPRKASVTVSTRYGDTSVIGRDGDVTITDQHGDVSATDIHGKVSLNLEHSSGRVSQVSSDVAIEGRADDVSIEDVKGGVRLDGEFMESVKLAKIAQPVSFHSSRTNIELFRLNGDLDLDSGDLDANDIVGPVRLTTKSKDVRLNGLAGDLRLEDENGSVEVHATKLGSMQVENRSGDIQIYVPDRAGFQVDARAIGGEIETDFDGLKIDNSNDNATATGSVGGGGPHVVINNQHGTIELRKGSNAPEAPEPPEAPRPGKAPKSPKAAKTPQVSDN